MGGHPAHLLRGTSEQGSWRGGWKSYWVSTHVQHAGGTAAACSSHKLSGEALALKGAEPTA
jgi:hypothetical protein